MLYLEHVKIILDGANIGRSHYFNRDYHGMARAEFDARRQQAGVHTKIIHANAILDVFRHIQQTCASPFYTYEAMLFLHTHVLDGGRNRAMHAFGVEKLLTDEMRPFLTTVPSGRDDDVAQLAYLARENQEGRSTYLLSNDLYADHVRGGVVSAEMLADRLISFTFVGDSSDVLLMKPNNKELDGL